jgi:hypothetical protein
MGEFWWPSFGLQTEVCLIYPHVAECEKESSLESHSQTVYFHDPNNFLKVLPFSLFILGVKISKRGFWRA